MNQDCKYKNGARPEGRYANYFEIGHNAFEFLMDLGQFYQDSKHAQIHTRIITGPSYAKALLKILGDAIDQYENDYGPIKEEGEDPAGN